MKTRKFLAAILAAALVGTSMIDNVFAANDSEKALPAEDMIVCVVEPEVIYDSVGDLYDIGPDISYFGMGTNSSFEEKFYNQLDSTSKGIYDALRETYKDSGSDATVDLAGKLADEQKTYSVSGTLTGSDFVVSAEDKENIIGDIRGYIVPALLALQMDHPELSWISHAKCSYGYSGSVSYPSGSTGEIEAEYTIQGVNFQLTSGYTYGTAEAISQAVAEARSSIDANAAERYELVEAIHDYLCENIEYNTEAAQEPSSYDEEQLGWYQTAYSAFYPVNNEKDIKTVCAGYAKAFKVLCDTYDIPCILVSGNAGTNGSMGAHMWNYVQMQDGNWYAVDVTWDDQGIKDQVNDTRTDYLLSGSETIGFDKTAFDDSHIKSGNWSGNGYTFVYPELSAEKYDPTATPVPTPTPEATPTAAPTVEPSPVPTPEATSTAAPTVEPSPVPTPEATPTAAPTVEPSPVPTPEATPTAAPTVEPSPVPTPEATPTAAPTVEPSPVPTPEATPTAAPTVEPSPVPTPEATPTAAPTSAPTAAPTSAPTAAPTSAPTAAPTSAPTAAPTSAPTAAPTSAPTAAPTSAPTAAPTSAPTAAPTSAPTAAPTSAPTAAPVPAPTQPSAQPYIKNAAGKEGWDVIIDEAQKKTEGSTIIVDMHGAAVVPKSVFDSIQGRDSNMIFDMGNGFAWCVNGMSVVPGQTADIDLTITKSDNIIPGKLISGVAGTQECMQIRLTHNGEFGLTAVLSVNVDKKNAGQEAKLYYYNLASNSLELVTSGKINENGVVELAFNHASDYVIVIESHKAGSDIKAPKTGEDDVVLGEIPVIAQRVNGHSWTALWIVLIIAAVLMAGIGIFYASRHVKED